MSNKLDVLSTIKIIETPPFLLTRIKQQIRNEADSPFSSRQSWVLGFSMVLILSLNIIILWQNQVNLIEKTSSIAQKMQLIPQNDFYK